MACHGHWPPAAVVLLLAVAAASGRLNDISSPYDPDVDMNTPQTIRKNGYPAESHIVQTADGYILTMHRIPRGRVDWILDASISPSPEPVTTREDTSSRPSTPERSTKASWSTSPSQSTDDRTTNPSTSYPRPTIRTTAGDVSGAWLATKSSTVTDTNQSWTTAAPLNANTTPRWTVTTLTTYGNTTRAWTPAESANEITTASVKTDTKIPVFSLNNTTTQPTTQPKLTTWATNTTTGPTTTPTNWTTPFPNTTTAEPPRIPTNWTTLFTTSPATPTTKATTSNVTTSFITTPIFTTKAPPTTMRSTTAPSTSAATSTTTSASTTTITTPPTTIVLPTIPTTQTTTTTTQPTTPTPTPPPLRPVVFLQHGLLGSSYDWIVAGPGKALAYLLADAGFDVWMGNARGNTYSRSHVYLPTEPSSPFWDFSFHEMGVYDLPAEIDYILNITGSQQLQYVGHSMGTTMFFVMATMKPEVATGVSSMFALAPVVFVKHMKSPIRLLAPFAHDVEFIARLLGEGEFLPQNKILHYLAKYGCELLETEKEVCENLIFILCGYDKPQFDSNILPVLLSHTPAGASTRTLIHYAQMIKSGKFQMYDFGKYMNLKEYHSLTPPTYDLPSVNVSVNLIYASNDWLASPVDVNALYQSLVCKKTKYLVPFPGFNHLDFILAKDVKTLLYDKLLNEIPRETYYQSYDDLFYD